MPDNIDISLRERLATVEMQQKHQKEVLLDISTTLKEVVKTQHILANQRKDIDRLIAENIELNGWKNQTELRMAAKDAIDRAIADSAANSAAVIEEELKPQHDKLKVFMRIGAVISSAAWALLIVYLQTL